MQFMEVYHIVLVYCLCDLPRMGTFKLFLFLENVAVQNVFAELLG